MQAGLSLLTSLGLQKKCVKQQNYKRIEAFFRTVFSEKGFYIHKNEGKEEINMLGISAYLQDLDVEYLKKAAEIGVRFVFTSLHIPEENLDDSKEKLDLLLKTCQENDLLLLPDISPVTYKDLGIKNRDMTGLKKSGIISLRLDFGFDDYQELVVLQKDFQLFLNASIVDETFLKESVTAGVDLSKV